jgi:hypothetical protein
MAENEKNAVERGIVRNGDGGIGGTWTDGRKMGRNE